MELLLFIGVIILFVLVFNLKGRVSRLERELHKAQNNPAEQSQIQAQVPGQMPPTLTQPQPAAAPIQLGPNWPTLFFNWLKVELSLDASCGLFQISGLASSSSNLFISKSSLLKSKQPPYGLPVFI